MAEENTPLTEEQKMRRRVARTIGRTMWRAEFKTASKAANKEVTKEELAAAWKEQRRKWTKNAMAALTAIEKEGVVISAPNGLSPEEPEDNDD